MERGGFFPHYIRPLRAASRYHFHSSTSHSLHSLVSPSYPLFSRRITVTPPSAVPSGDGTTGDGRADMKVMGSGRFTSLFVRPVSHPAAVPFHSTLFTALRSGENPPGTGPSLLTHAPYSRFRTSLVVPKGRSLPRSLRSLPSLHVSGSPLASHTPHPAPTPRSLLVPRRSLPHPSLPPCGREPSRRGPCPFGPRRCAAE